MKKLFEKPYCEIYEDITDVICASQEIIMGEDEEGNNWANAD